MMEACLRKSGYPNRKKLITHFAHPFQKTYLTISPMIQHPVSFSLFNLTHSTFFFNGYEKAVEIRSGDVGNISKTEPRPFAADRPFLNEDLVLSLLSHNHGFSFSLDPNNLPDILNAHLITAHTCAQKTASQL